jgi:hypothetical protein
MDEVKSQKMCCCCITVKDRCNWMNNTVKYWKSKCNRKCEIEESGMNFLFSKMKVVNHQKLYSFIQYIFTSHLSLFTAKHAARNELGVESLCYLWYHWEKECEKVNGK